VKIEFRDQRRGTLRVRIEDLDDLWHLSQVIFPGDTVSSKTERRIKDKQDSRSKGGERLTITITLLVDSVELKPENHVLRISGKITGGPEDVITRGSHHTIGATLGSVLTIVKDKWSKTEWEQISAAVENSSKPKVLVLCMDVGETTISVVHGSRIENVDLDRNIGGKYDIKDREKRRKTYYHEILDALSNLMDKNIISAVILCGPGFEKNTMHSFMKEFKPEIASKCTIEDVGAGGRGGVREALSKSSASKALENLNSIRDMRLMEEILVEIGKDSGLAAYGMDEVISCVNSNAAEKTLVTDRLFSERRAEIEALFSSLRSSGGKPHIIDVKSEAGQKLSSLGGIAAKLRFRLS
jgi:protein pelota